MIKYCFAFLFTIISIAAFAQEELSSSNWKMTQAKLLFEDNKTLDAMTIYKELLVDYPTDGLLNYRLGVCSYKLGDLEQSNEYLNIALFNSKDAELTKEIQYLQACVFHKLSDFDFAIRNLNAILTGTATVDSIQIKRLLDQVEIAKYAYSNFENYTVVNAGASINTEFNEIYPVFSRLEAKLFFTSDRQIKETQEKLIVSNSFPYSVFEAITDEAGVPSKPELVDETFASGKNFILNSVSISDGSFFLYKHTPELLDGGDLYIDTKDTDEDFTEPEKIQGVINLESYEYSASFDFINDRLYFVTDRKDKAKINSEVFLSELFKGKFPEPGIVDNLNSVYNESFVYVHPGGDFAVLSSNCDKSMGGYDLFISYNKDGKWSQPKNLGCPINTTSDEKQFTLSSDGKYAYISSDRPGGMGGYDIYTVEFTSFLTENCSCNPTLVFYSGQVVDSEMTGVVADLKITDLANSKNQQDIKTDAEGFYSFAVTAGKKYKLTVKNKLYEEYSEDIDAIGTSELKFEKDIELVVKP